MAKAVRVRGIRPKDSLRENAQKIVGTRLAELLSWREALLDPTAIQDLHDMRIAAKRLRYALEMFEICFPNAKQALEQLTEIQESIGDIHDLDVLIDLMRDRLKALDSSTEHAAVKIMESDASSSEKSNKLRQALYSQARDRKRLGLIGLVADHVVERSRQFASFQERWGGGALDTFASELLTAIGGLTEDAQAPPQDEAGQSSDESTPSDPPKTTGDEEVSAAP
jgi:hypothetical protein